MGRTRHLRALPLALAALLLVACGSHPSADPPPASPSPSPTASTPTAPVMPALAKQRNSKGARAFVGFFIETMNRASVSGETSSLRALFETSCSNCQAIADGIDTVYAAGGHISGRGWIARGFKTYGFDGQRYPVDALITASPQRVVAKSGGKTTTYPGDKRRVEYFDIAWRAGAWTTIGLDQGR